MDLKPVFQVSGNGRQRQADSVRWNQPQLVQAIFDGPWVGLFKQQGDQAFNLTTSFEKLIGPQGGGTREEQIAELGRIADHVGLRHSPALLGQIADAVFGGTKTFRKGTIGTWAADFTDDHKRAFKEVAGDALIAMGYEQDHEW